MRRSPWAYPDAHQLAEQGWFERRFIGPAGEMRWHWTPQADTTLGLSSIIEGQSPN